jgi:23S rRNA (cytidine2498-2'-O)-methyltransferase
VPPPPLHAFLTSLGFERALEAELGAAVAGGPRWPAVVAAPRALPAVDPVFARQQLPGAMQVQGGSVRALAEAALAATDAAVDAAAGALTLHAFVPEARAYRSLGGRAALVGEAWQALLRERRRRAFRRLVPAQEAAGRWGEALLVQLALVGRGSLLVSAASPQALPGGGTDLAPWPAGDAPVAEDRRAPSRAYRKLVEAFAWLGGGPAAGESCVDLGGSPGGWAWTALSRGARVTAVDRAPLAAPAAGHPALTMVVGNAFTHRPAAPVDWLLCDVICEPARTVELVLRWMAGGLCRRVVASVKFKGSDYRLLDEAAARLRAPGWPFLRIKHLRHHHNEAAIMASADRLPVLP